MADIPPLNVRVVIDANGVQAGVSTVTAGLEQISGKAKLMTGSLAKFKELALGVFGGNILTAGVMGLERAFAEMRQEAIATEAATVSLETALENMGVTSKEQKDAIESNVEAYGSLGFKASEATNAMSVLVTATGSVTQANKLMALSADLARKKHIDIESAARILARGTQGAARAFKEMGITLDTSLPKNKAIAKAFDELNSKIGGQAQAYMKTFAGQMNKLKESLQQVATAISKAVLPFFKLMVQYLGSLITYVKENATALKIFASIVIVTAVAIKSYTSVMAATKAIQQAYAFWTYAQTASTSVFRFALSALWTTMKANPLGFIVTGLTILAAAFAYAWKHSQTFRNIVVTALQTVLKAFGWLVEKVGSLLRVMSHIPGMGFLKKFADDADKASKAIAKTADNLDKLRKLEAKDTAPKITGVTAPGSATGITGNVPGGNAAGTAGGSNASSTVQYVTVYASNTNDIAKKLSKAAKNGLPIGVK